MCGVGWGRERGKRRGRSRGESWNSYWLTRKQECKTNGKEKPKMETSISNPRAPLG